MQARLVRSSFDTTRPPHRSHRSQQRPSEKGHATLKLATTTNRTERRPLGSTPSRRDRGGRDDARVRGSRRARSARWVPRGRRRSSRSWFAGRRTPPRPIGPLPLSTSDTLRDGSDVARGHWLAMPEGVGGPADRRSRDAPLSPTGTEFAWTWAAVRQPDVGRFRGPQSRRRGSKRGPRRWT